MHEGTFDFYKTYLLHISGRTDPGRLRYNCIQYVCSFPEIDPAEMAAVLQSKGIKIMFDDSSISAKANDAHRAEVARIAKTHGCSGECHPDSWAKGTSRR